MKTLLHFYTCVALILISFAANDLLAHAGGHGKGFLRTWHLPSGKHHLHASFHSFHGDTVVLEKAGGALLSLPLSALDEHDRLYAEERIAYIKAINEQPLPHLAPSPSPSLLPSPSLNASSLPVWLWQIAFILGVVLIPVLAWTTIRAYRRQLHTMLRISTGAAVLLAAGGVYCVSTQAEMLKIALSTNPLSMDSTFSAFKPQVSTRWDNNYFYVENNGMPSSMPAMKGITAWQQQVPLPQLYSGSNAWSIPLNPEYAATPLSTSNALFTGAIALGVNGLPVFNAKNNRGEYSYDIGELDAFGGHCGRADDYHYHIAPLHLQTTVGTTKPIAWALDGYPLYGNLEPDGSPMKTLDANLGHEWANGYHYHAVTTRPYFIAALRGKVTVQNDQIMPQAQTKGVRPFLQPLNGAVITDFHKCGSNHYALKYTLKGKTQWVNYRWDVSGNYTFNFVDSTGTIRTETYKRK